jgi:hypothetical protein
MRPNKLVQMPVKEQTVTLFTQDKHDLRLLRNALFDSLLLNPHNMCFQLHY